MASKINYNNKAPFQTREDIPDINKVNAEDMNEIKSVVNTNADELDTAKENIENLQNGQGTSNADITSLKNRVTTLETDNTTNKQDISNLKSRTTTLETDNETNKTNISTLQEDVEEIEGNITELQTEQTAQNQKIEQLDDNQIHITTEKSSNINVQDASGQNAKINIFGISKQETRSGINLTNYKEWVGLSTKEQITKKDDDEIICTITDNSYGVRDIERILKPNTNYTACVDSKFSGNLGSQYGLRVNINGSITSLKADGLVNFTTDETGKAEMRYYVGFPYSGENATLTVSNIRLYEGTYTKENIPDYEDYGASPSPKYPSKIENTGDNINYFDISKITNKGALTNNGDGSLTMQNNENTLGFIQINQTLKQLCPELKAGDIIAFSFKTTTQNSTYKDRIYAGDFLFNGESKEITQAMLDAYVCFYGGYNEISTISNIKIEKGTKTTSYSPYKCGSVEITDCNKNIFNVDEFKDFFDLTETGTDEGHNYVAYTTKSYANNKFMQGKFKANTQYTISFLGRQKQVGQGQTSGFVFNYTDGTSSIKYVNNDEIWTEYTLISDKNKTIDYIFMAWAYGGTIWLSDIQLEVNNVTTDYIEHEQQVTTFPLVQGQKMYEGSETEDDGIHHKRKQKELDGTETVYDSGNNETTHHFTIPFEDKKIGQHNALSNMFINSTVATLVYSLVENPSIARITFKMPLEYTTVDSFKTFLAQQKQAGTPVIVEYELAEEEIEPYTEEQQAADDQLQNAKTYKTVTNVFTENAEVEMKYVAHTKTYIDNKVNNMQNQLNTINELLSTTNTSALLLNNLQTDLESEVL